MRHNILIYRIISLAFLALLFIGCENKWPSNGDFDGMWQLMSIEKDGKVTSLKDTKHYWSVRTNLIQFTKSGNGDRKYAHFERKDGKLILTDFCYNWGNTEDKKNNEWIASNPITDRDILNPWGIYADTDTAHPERLTESFNIDVLNYDCLILSTTEYRLEFRKF